MKTYLAIYTDTAVYHDGLAHSIEEWKEILTKMKVDFKFVKPFHLTEDNYEG